jgi:hypothetical protein
MLQRRAWRWQLRGKAQIVRLSHAMPGSDQRYIWKRAIVTNASALKNP